MEEKVNNHIEVSLESVRKIFIKFAERVEQLKPGEKIPATKLAKELGEEIGIAGPQLYQTLLFVIKNYPGVVIKRGANGGIEKL